MASALSNSHVHKSANCPLKMYLWYILWVLRCSMWFQSRQSSPSAASNTLPSHKKREKLLLLSRQSIMYYHSLINSSGSAQGNSNFSAVSFRVILPSNVVRPALKCLSSFRACLIPLSATANA